MYCVQILERRAAECNDQDISSLATVLLGKLKTSSKPPRTCTLPSASTSQRQRGGDGGDGARRARLNHDEVACSHTACAAVRTGYRESASSSHAQTAAAQQAHTRLFQEGQSDSQGTVSPDQAGSRASNVDMQHLQSSGAEQVPAQILESEPDPFARPATLDGTWVTTPQARSQGATPALACKGDIVGISGDRMVRSQQPGAGPRQRRGRALHDTDPAPEAGSAGGLVPVIAADVEAGCASCSPANHPEEACANFLDGYPAASVCSPAYTQLLPGGAPAASTVRTSAAAPAEEAGSTTCQVVMGSGWGLEPTSKRSDSSDQDQTLQDVVADAKQNRGSFLKELQV